MGLRRVGELAARTLGQLRGAPGARGSRARGYALASSARRAAISASVKPASRIASLDLVAAHRVALVDARVPREVLEGWSRR